MARDTRAELLRLQLRKSTADGYFGAFTGRFQPGNVSWRPRAIVSSLSGASLVITEPAPIVASLPIVTGATSALFDPMKAPSSIRVVALFTPS